MGETAMTWRQRALRRWAPRRFIANEDGVTVIEFAMLGLPFFLLIFAILEICIAFAAQQLLTNATDDVARMFRTGQIRTVDQMDEPKLRKMICDRISVLISGGCPGLKVDLRQYATFEQAAQASTDYATLTPQVNLGLSQTKNMLRVFYKWPVLTNLFAKATEDGDMILYASMTWQNEPFND